MVRTRLRMSSLDGMHDERCMMSHASCAYIHSRELMYDELTPCPRGRGYDWRFASARSRRRRHHRHLREHTRKGRECVRWSLCLRARWTPHLQSTHPDRNHVQVCTLRTRDVARPLNHRVQVGISLHALAPLHQDRAGCRQGRGAASPGRFWSCRETQHERDTPCRREPQHVTAPAAALRLQL